MTKRFASWVAVAVLAVLTGCGPKDAPQTAGAGASAPKVRAAPGTLAWAIQGPWRLEPSRDRYRHPAETLAFFGLKPDMVVVEALPGRGWYTAILAPYLARGGGKLYAASFDPLRANEDQLATLTEFKARYLGGAPVFGAIELTILSPYSSAIAPPGSADMVLAANVTHAFMVERYAETAFAAFFEALKPGGLLCIEEHRARSSGLQDPQAGTGYVQEEYVKLLAQEAGFEFVGSSEINANANDTKDHPFGVWTLPPVLRTAPLGMPENPGFDTAKYVAIGESDRMTLKFRKPGPAADLRGASLPDGKS